MGGAFYQQANSENFSFQGILKGKSAKLRLIKEVVSMCTLPPLLAKPNRRVHGLVVGQQPFGPWATLCPE